MVTATVDMSPIRCDKHQYTISDLSEEFERHRKGACAFYEDEGLIIPHPARHDPGIYTKRDRATAGMDTAREAGWVQPVRNPRDDRPV